MIHAILKTTHFFIANLSVGPIETALRNISANKSSPLEILKLNILLCSTTEKMG